MKRRSFAFLIPIALAGCIPPSPNYSNQPPPRIEPEMDTVYDERPVWEDRPATANAKPIPGGTYVVQSGDTLSAIGERSGVGLSAVAKANSLSAPYSLRVGQKLIIPTGRFHTVSAGDTGIAIARAYGVSWSRIVDTNSLIEPFVLKVGQRLEIPTKAVENPTSPSPSLEDRAAAFKLDIDDIVTGGEPAQEEGVAIAPSTQTPNVPLSPGLAVAEPTRFVGSFGWPVLGTVVGRFGPQSEGDVNQGIEIAASPGAPIRASSDGVVAFAGNNVANFGGMILIRHGSGWITAYGRAARATVTRGQSVKRGDVIGEMGSGSAPKLHFEIRQGRTPVNPLTKLPAS